MRKLPAKVKALAEELNQAVRSGMLELPGDEAGNLNAALNAAFSRATFDPMNDAWEALRKALMRPETPAC